MKRGSSLPAWLILGGFAALLVLERRRPLRRPVEPPWRRDVRNLAVGAASAAALQVLERPVVDPLADLALRRRWGLLHRSGLPGWIAVPLAVALMDYTLYLWHVLLHRVPFLWRFHLVHHADLDLSTTTALRFHFAEMALSVPWRAAQVLILGIGPGPLALWRNLTAASVLFHHSNLRLPARVDRRLASAIVTPRMHGIHHSTVLEETNSNWSSGLTLWDRLHGTLRLDVPQDAVRTGVPDYRNPDELTLGRILALPFRGPGRERRLPGKARPVPQNGSPT